LSAVEDKASEGSGIEMSATVATIDFHVTSECSQECPYCWGPQDFENPVDTETALQIVERVKQSGAKRIVFTGGDPVKRSDIHTLLRHAKEIGLEVALSTTGDELSPQFLVDVHQYIDLISLPLDGPTEAVNSRTKKKGHFAAIMQALEWLRGHPRIDVKLCTPVTRQNLEEIPAIVRLAEAYAGTTEARVFYNVFQAYPRSMLAVDWGKLLVTDEEFGRLETSLAGENLIRVNFLDHETLDRLYVMVFPDGSLVVPSGSEFLTYGQFLEMEDLNAVLETSEFDSAKHVRHARGWRKGV
jgi:MoaA/NifB/PqqE/SkfB family radical SAM enzyme